MSSQKRAAPTNTDERAKKGCIDWFAYLPLEVVAEIVSCISFTDIRSMRAVCRTTRDLLQKTSVAAAIFAKHALYVKHESRDFAEMLFLYDPNVHTTILASFNKVGHGVIIWNARQFRLRQCRHAINTDNARLLRFIADVGGIPDTLLYGEPTLFFACEIGGLRMVNLLLGLGANVHQLDIHGRTPLIHATRYGQIAVMRRLLERGADPNARKNNFKTALMVCASKCDFVEGVQLLVAKGADVNAYMPHRRYETALSIAATHGHAHVARVLLDNHAYINGDPEAPTSPLLIAAQQGHVSVVRELLRRGARIAVKSMFGETAVMAAAMQPGHESATILGMLLERDATHINDVDNSHCTALHRAIRINAHDCVEILLAYGADVDIPDDTGRTAIDLIFDGAQVSLFQLFIKSAKDVDGVDGVRRESYLIRILRHVREPLEFLSVLLPRSTAVNYRSDDDLTPLMLSLEFPDTDIMLVLITHGADLDAVSNGQTALMMAVAKKKLWAVNVLLDAGANVNAATPNGVTALMFACRHGAYIIAETLLKYGADASMTTPTGHTALSIAQRVNATVIVLLLRKHLDRMSR